MTSCAPRAVAQRGSLSIAAIWAFRTVVVINFVRFGLSFFVDFEGTTNQIGLSDKLFSLRFGGFRIDFVWLVVTTPLILLFTLFHAAKQSGDPTAKLDAILGASWVLAFVFYTVRALLMLYVG
jgi:hypothetical protein